MGITGMQMEKRGGRESREPANGTRLRFFAAIVVLILPLLSKKQLRSNA